VTTVYTRATCPIGRKQSEPCPCQLDPSTSTPVRDPPQWVRDIERITSWCNACLTEWHERAALIADGCRLTQPQAEEEATRQLMDAVAAAERKQWSLFT
jgi:hypothetical protein